jgi:phosphotransferase system enzyme I (PtsI)
VTTTLQGIGVSHGLVAGPVAKLSRPPVLPATSAAIADADKELATAGEVLEEVAVDLEQRARRGSEQAAAVLTAEALMARDPALAELVGALVKEGRDAAHAVAEALDSFGQQLVALGGYMAERAADLVDIRNRAVARLLGLPMPGVPDPGHPFVLVADDLAPADTATLDTELVLAIVTERGGPTSHTAIISKSLGLPAVVACAGATDLVDGTAVLVDGEEGTVIIEPPDTLVRSQLGQLAARRRAATKVSGPGRTADGAAVKLLVNLGGPNDVAKAATADSEGAGLLRTEFLFLDRAQAPSLQEQQAAYAEVFHHFTGRKVVVRTLDAGADKPLAFVTQPDEPNPALGRRGVRTARLFPELLDTQLRAIARAAASSGADVWVMAPMVSTPAEAADFVALAHRHGLPVAGAMVEVPAAALRAADMAEACDFLSVGTNDLAQYTYAADRTIGDLADLLDPWQPAVLQLIRMTAEAGRAFNKPVSVCGEAASDPLLALVLVGFGVTSLSMAPVSLAEVRAAIARHSLAECRDLAALALSAADGRAARAAVRAAASSP